MQPTLQHLDPNYCHERCRQLRLGFVMSLLLSHLPALSMFLLDIPLFTLTWPAKHSLDQGSEFTSWLHLCSCVNLNAIDQSHRYGRHQAACREPAGSYDKTTRTAICFEHKTQHLLIRAPYTRIVVFWHIPPMISQSQLSCYTHTFYIAAIFVKYCYTTGSWLL